MKKLIIAATILMAGTALAQTPPPGPSAPAASPVHDRVTTRAEAVEKVRQHFGKLDTNRDGSVTKDEVMDGRWERGKGFRAMGGEHAEGGAPHVMMLDGPRGDPNAAFDRLDTNKDGSISREEFAAGREKRLERRIVMREQRRDGAGTPKDGKEVRKHVMRMHGRGPFGAHMIVMADTDKDGKITQAEAEALALQHFDRMDSNKDGQVTPEERRAGRPMIIKHIEEKKSGS
jgi:hypothetical protein